MSLTLCDCYLKSHPTVGAPKQTGLFSASTGLQSGWHDHCNWLVGHWLQFWQLRTWIHDNLCDLTIKSGHWTAFIILVMFSASTGLQQSGWHDHWLVGQVRRDPGGESHTSQLGQVNTLSNRLTDTIFYSNTQTLNTNTNIQIHKYTNTQTQVHKYFTTWSTVCLTQIISLSW